MSIKKNISGSDPKTWRQVMAEKREEQYKNIDFLPLFFKIFFLFPCFLFALLNPEGALVVFKYVISAYDFILVKIFAALILSFFIPNVVSKIFSIIGFVFGFMADFNSARKGKKENQKIKKQKAEFEKQFSATLENISETPEYVEKQKDIQIKKRKIKKEQ